MEQDVLKILFDILESYREAVIAERGGVIVCTNGEARAAFGENLEGKELSEIFTEDICAAAPEEGGKQTFAFTAGEISGAINVQNISNIRIFTMTRSEEAARLSELLRVISNALGAPKESALAAAELIYSGDLLIGAETGQTMGIIMRDTLRILRISENVNLLAALIDGDVKLKPEKLDFVRLIGGLTGAVAELADECGIELNFSSTDSKLGIYADRSLIEILLLNLLSNAIKFSSYGGKVAVKLTRVGKKIRLTVFDNGVGMSGEVFGSAFARYSMPREDASENAGAGVGLALVSAIARAHGGMALIDSKEGNGTTVTVAFQSEERFSDEDDGERGSFYGGERSRRLIMVQMADALGFKCYDPLYMW